MLTLLFYAPLTPGQNLLDTLANKTLWDITQLVDKADYILVVKKATPFMTVKRTPIDSVKKIPPFENHIFHFKILNILKSDSLPPEKSTIDVWESYKDLGYTVHYIYHVKKMAMQTIIGIYKPAGSIDTMDTMIVFLHREKNPNKPKRAATYSFCIRNAYESMEKKEEINAILKKLYKNPDPWRWIKMRRQQRKTGN